MRIIFSLLLGLSERKVSHDPGDETVQKKRNKGKKKKRQYSKYTLYITSFHLLTPENFLLGTTAVICATSRFYVFNLAKGRGRICIGRACGGVWPAEYGTPAFGSRSSLSTT